MADSSERATDSRRPMWIVILVGTVFVLLALVNLYAQVTYSYRATRESGQIVATEGGIGRIRSVTAKVDVVPSDAAKVSVEIEDTLGTHGWKPGDSIPMLCTRLHADHVSCVADLWLDRYAFSLALLIVGALAIWGGIPRRR